MQTKINQRDSQGKKQGYWEEEMSINVISKGRYLDNKKDGLWEYYEANGVLIAKVRYKAGVKNGEYVSYNSRNPQTLKGEYKNDIQDGHWESYFHNGKLSYKGCFKNNRQIGLWHLGSPYDNNIVVVFYAN